MTAYHCDFAWLGGDGVAAAVQIEVDGERISDIRAGAERSVGATHLAGLIGQAPCEGLDRLAEPGLLVTELEVHGATPSEARGRGRR